MNILKLPRLEDYLKEMESRGPNVELLVRIALRKPRVAGLGSVYELYLTSSYLRDVGPQGDYQSTLILVTFDHLIGRLTGVPANDDPVVAQGESTFNQIKDLALRLRFEFAPGYYTNLR